MAERWVEVLTQWVCTIRWRTIGIKKAALGGRRVVCKEKVGSIGLERDPLKVSDAECASMNYT